MISDLDQTYSAYRGIKPVEDLVLSIQSDSSSAKSKDWDAAFAKYGKDQDAKVAEMKKRFGSVKLTDLTTDEIENARHVYENHLVPRRTIASVLESAYFCILSQNTAWEIPTRFIENMRELSYPTDPNAKNRVASIPVLTNYAAIAKASEKAKHHWAVDNRCRPFIEYFLLNADQTAHDFNAIGTSNVDERKSFCDRVMFFDLKTYSFLDLMHKGKDFITLDVHVMRGLYTMGVDMSEWYFVKKPRKPNETHKRNGRLVGVTCRPSRKEYRALELAAFDMFGKDDRFKTPDGRVDGGLVTTLLWWRGAGRRHVEADMFGYQSSQQLPYGPNLRVD